MRRRKKNQEKGKLRGREDAGNDWERGGESLLLTQSEAEKCSGGAGRKFVLAYQARSPTIRVKPRRKFPAPCFSRWRPKKKKVGSHSTGGNKGEKWC